MTATFSSFGRSTLALVGSLFFTTVLIAVSNSVLVA